MKRKICSVCKENKKANKDFRPTKTSNGIPSYRADCRRCESAATTARTRRRDSGKPCTTQDILNEWNNQTDEKELENQENIINNLASGLCAYVNHNMEKLHFAQAQDFWDTNHTAKQAAKECKVNFDKIKEIAEDKLKEEYGLKYPTGVQLGEGVYLVVGDSHGKHMKTKMFQLLKNLDSHINFDNIIHVGHLFDEDMIMSYHWKTMEKSIILTKKEELKTIAKTLREWQHEGIDYMFDVMRDELYLGDLKVRNQDQFPNEYVMTSIENLEQAINQQSTIVNFHRHEMTSKPTFEGENILYMTPGCLCEQHHSKTRLTKDYTRGDSKKELFADGFNQARRRGELQKVWEQGLYVIHVDAHGAYTPIPCRIKDIDENGTKAVAYLDKIITSDKKDFIQDPDNINLVTSDAHVPYVDPVVNAIISSFTTEVTMDNHINLGDLCQNESVNHHNLSKDAIAKYAHLSLIQELACAYHYLKNTLQWANKHYYIFGNHERFIVDFTDKWPQLTQLLDIKKLLRLDELDINLIEHKEILYKNNAQYLHGDLRCYGQRGNLFEKTARNYDAQTNPIFVGHIHYPGIRLGCYSVGMTGLLDQGYNEPTASRWMHGFGLSTSFRGIGWNTTIPLVGDRLYINGIHYDQIGNEDEKWENPEEIDFFVNYEY